MNVLLIEDNPGDATLIRQFLKDGTDTYHVTHVDRIADATQLLSKKEHGFDVIISDIALPDSQGMQSFQKLRKVAADLPVIFNTGTHDEEMAVAALHKGAQDYLLKGQFEGDTLRRSIRYAVERKKFQNEVEQAKASTRRLRQEAALLKEQREQLMSLNKAKDDFISLASHQLRTPATGVKQYIGLLLEGYAGDLDPQQREFLELAYESNERQLKIVSDLLRTAQIDAGQVSLKRKKTDLAKLIKGVVHEQSVQLRARNQNVSIDLPNETRATMVDSDKLRMAIENLLDNASKYTPHNKSITVSLREDDDTSTITIKDEGVGIDEDDIDKIFQKFSRVSNMLSDEVGGSGLGLYWVHNIVELHDGTINVTSTPGKGTSFVIQLPHYS